MPKHSLALDAETAMTFLGNTVLVELAWDDEPDTYWHCLHVIGVVLPVEGVCDQGYFITVPLSGMQHTLEIYFQDVVTIRAIRHRDRQGSGNVLGRMTRPIQEGSRAALPARRNSSTVPSNGSTGAAHP